MVLRNNVGATAPTLLLSPNNRGLVTLKKKTDRYSLSLVAAIVAVVTCGGISAWASEDSTDASVQLASGDSSLDIGNESGGEVVTRCTEPRPQVCTREYWPVCAQMQDGSSRTYATGDTAFSDPDVAGYVDGTCE